jgi:hypothetical protein
MSGPLDLPFGEPVAVGRVGARVFDPRPALRAPE